MNFGTNADFIPFSAVDLDLEMERTGTGDGYRRSGSQWPVLLNDVLLVWLVCSAGCVVLALGEILIYLIGDRSEDTGEEDQNDGQQLVPATPMADLTDTTGTGKTSSPLKGIISTNDDPFRCAKCSGPLLGLTDVSGHLPTPCCGKVCCKSCDFRLFDDDGAPRCSFCGFSGSISSHVTGTIKKSAKKGHPWAQHFFARALQLGAGGVPESSFDAVRWFRKAVAKGHPDSMVHLGSMLCEGQGCEQDLTLAVEYAERAMEIDLRFSQGAVDVLAGVAEQYDELGNPERAISILSPLAEFGNVAAQRSISDIYIHIDDHLSALKWSEMAFFGDDDENADEYGSYTSVMSALKAMSCCYAQRNLPRARFWQLIANKGLRLILSRCHDPNMVVQSISALRGVLRSIRDRCGGCGATLQGAMRKKCGGCKTICYCSRECQKLHWNRSKDSHRDECKGVMELKERLKSSRKEK